MPSFPLCTAPFTSLVIDTHKGVRPCCSWDDLYLGNLNEQNLAQILRGPRWTALKEQHRKQQWPRGCVNCKKREEESGWSLRQSYLDKEFTRDGSVGSYYSPQWEKGLTYLELNSSNLCNLACMHCTGAFSSRWVIEEKRLEKNGYHFEGHGTGNPDGRRFQTHELHLPNERLLLDNLSTLDLQRLEYVNVKGGEPMLNSDVRVLLAYLQSEQLLGNVEVDISMNGTLVREEILEHLRYARKVNVWLSVDGVGRVQQYIRHGKASIPRIETTLRALAALPTVEFGLCTSVMPYNIFSLDRIHAWWESLRAAFPGRRFHDARFSLMIVVPQHLSLRCLQDATRDRLVSFYQDLNPRQEKAARRESNRLTRRLQALYRKVRGQREGPYSDVLQALQQPYLGHEMHNRFVHYTKTMDTCRRKNVLDAVPELRNEMVIL